MNKPLEMDVADAAVSTEEKVTWREYVRLTKPGIVRSNLLGAFAGFWVASGWNVDWLQLIYMLIGTTLVLASACVFNNYLDREMDVIMERTRERALPSGKVKPAHVLWYGSLLGAVGLILLAVLVNMTAFLFAVAGLFFYVIVYTLWLKRRSTWSTSIGGISGAMPPVIGYTAVSGEVDMGAILLFAILFLWQPPHFWALGIRRKEEYRAAGFPLLPVVKGVKRTKWQMIPYLVLLLPVSSLLYFYDYTGMYYLIIVSLLGGIWLTMALIGLRTAHDERWATGMFVFSINWLLIAFVAMILNTIPA